MAIASTGTNYFWPMLIFGIIALVSTVTLSYVIQKLKQMQGFAGLVNVMAECKGKPMGIYADKGGNLVPFVIERSKTNRGLIDHKFTLLHPIYQMLRQSINLKMAQMSIFSRCLDIFRSPSFLLPH